MVKKIYEDFNGMGYPPQILLGKSLLNPLNYWWLLHPLTIKLGILPIKLLKTI
jgi:hypothetical protein